MLKGFFVISDLHSCSDNSWGRDPLRSIELICSFSLYDSIYSVIPEHFPTAKPAQPTAPCIALSAASILNYLLKSRNQASNINLPDLHPLFYQALDEDTTCLPRLYLAASLTPYKGLTYRDKKKDRLLVGLIIRASLKLGTQSHFLDGIPLLFSAIDIISRSINETTKLHPTSERVGIGMHALELTVSSILTEHRFITARKIRT